MKKELLGYDDFVMKQKPLIDAKVEKAQVVKASYTEKEHDLLNALLYTLQTRTFSENTLDFWNNQDDTSNRTFVFAEAELKKLAKIKDTSADALKEVIRGLRDKRLEIKNFTLEKIVDGEFKKVKQHYIGSMVESAVFEKVGKMLSVKLQLSPIFVLLARRDYNISNGNFALIPYSKSKELSGLVPKKLIEYISKYPIETKIIRLNEENLEKICNKQPAFAHYKKILNSNLSKLSNLIELKITLWNSKLRICELEILEWKIERPNEIKSNSNKLNAFIKHVRENYANQLLYSTEEGEMIMCSLEGLLYNYKTSITYTKERSMDLWKIIFDYHSSKQ